MLDKRLFLEGYGSGAQGRLAALIARAKSHDPLAPVTVVVPATHAGLSLRRSLGKPDGLLNVRFMALPRLAEYIGGPALAGQGKSPLSPVMRLAAIRRFAGEMAGQSPLGAIAGQPSFHNYLAGTFTTLAMVPESDLPRLENKSPLLTQVMAWYRKYRGLVAGYYDREELARAAAASVTTGTCANVLQDLGDIIFFLIPRLSPAELSLVSAVGTHGRGAVILGLCGEEPVDDETLRLASRLEAAFGPAQAAAPAPGDYLASHITITPDARDEVRWVIRRLAREAETGVSFHRMAVLYRNADPYAGLIKNQLELAGIPAAGPDPGPLSGSPSGKLLLYGLEIFEGDFARETVLRWLAETPVKIENASPADTGAWERISGEAGIIKGADRWLERLKSYHSKMEARMARSQEDDAGIEPAKLAAYAGARDAAGRLMSLVKRLVASAPPAEGSSWKEYVDWAQRFTGRYCDLSSWPAGQLGSHKMVEEALDNLRELDALGPGGATLTGFRQMLEDVLGSVSGRLGPLGTGVFVAPVTAAQGMDFEAVFIVGLAEGAFPPALADDAIIPDAYKNELSDIALLPLRSVRRLDERRLFLAAMASGKKRYLSFPRSGSTGQRRGYPSAWLLKEANLLHARELKAAGKPAPAPGEAIGSGNLELSGGESWLSVTPSAYQSIASLSGLSPADGHDHDLHSLARWRAAGHRMDRHFLMANDGALRRILDMERGRSGKSFTQWDGNISALAGKSPRISFGEGRPLAPTSLELWAACPFRYYLAHVLEIPVLERPEEIESISPLDKGSLVHDILEKFTKDQKIGYGEPWNKEHRESLMRIAEERLAMAQAQGKTGKPLLWELARQQIMDDLLSLLADDNERRSKCKSKPAMVEYRFGFGEEACPPVILQIAGGKELRFKGIIDRVDADASNSSLTVIDYKTGKLSSYADMKKDDPLGAGKRLQLPLYSLAVRGRFPGAGQVTAAYWFITSTAGFNRKQVELSTEVEDRLATVVTIIASGIEAGLFPVHPGAGNSCDYCDYQRVCPSDRGPHWERKSGNPELADYIAMTGGGLVEEGEE